jgi:hypothetical protein
MNIECHFIPRTFHCVSFYFVLNSSSLRYYALLRTHSFNLARKFPSARLAMFSGISETCSQIAILRSLTVRGLVIYTFALRYFADHSGHAVLRHDLSSLARTLGSWVRNPFEAWLFILGIGLAMG